MHRRNRQQKAATPATTTVANLKDDPNHYRFTTVADKHNVFNRKLLRKAKRHGVKDLTKFMEENKKGAKKKPLPRGKGLQDKKEVKAKKKERKMDSALPEKGLDLNEIYTEEANKEYMKHMIEEDDREIRRYEKLLGIKSKDDKRKRIFKDMMQDDEEDEDLFDFLDNISKKVHSDTVEDYTEKMKKQKEKDAKRRAKEEEEKEAAEEIEEDQEDYEAEEDEGEGEEGMEDEEVEGYNEEYDEEEDMEDMEGMEDYEEEEGGEFEEGEDEAEAEVEGIEEQEEEEKIENVGKANTRFDREEILKQLDPQKKQELERALRGSINRVAEGNIESIFKQLVELYNKNPKYVINELYSEIFIKSCVEQPHLLQMIFASNACLLAALYQLLDDNFLADFLRKIVIAFKENFAEIIKGASEIHQGDGERPAVYKTRNTLLVFCFLYDFDVLNEDFMQEIILYLADHLNSDTISNILTVIQNSGFKIRQNSPGSLKIILDYLRGKYEEKKQNQDEKEQLSKKMDFMFLNINDLKHNKKISNDAQDRLTILLNFLKKSVVSKSGKVQKKFPTRFSDLIKNDFTHPRWWMAVHILDKNRQEEKDFQTEILGGVQNDYIDKLERVATEQRFTSDLRKKIFVVIMSAEDYLDATQKLLKMKLNKKQVQELAVVIVESCAQEENFNKYYGYLAENLIKLRSGLKYSFQYAFWDHFKQLENYGLRKIANLAKLLSFLVIRKDMGIQSLRSIEFEALGQHQELFLKIFFKDLYKLVDQEKISQMFRSINENENFAVFREGLKEYLQEKLLKTLKKNTDNNDEKELRDKIKRSCQVIKGAF